jgi:hypothetical protein
LVRPGSAGIIQKEAILLRPGWLQGHGQGKLMADVLTIAGIHSRFVSEWVLVEDPQVNQSLEVQSGKVLFHSKDRDEVYRKALALRPPRFALLYTGTMPEDTAIVL